MQEDVKALGSIVGDFIPTDSRPPVADVLIDASQVKPPQDLAKGRYRHKLYHRLV